MTAGKVTVTDRETMLTVDMLSIGEGAFSIDQRHRIVSWNDTATQLLGYASKDVLGKVCHTVLGLCHAQTAGQPCNYPCFTLHNADARVTESDIVHFETQVAGQDGREHRLTVTLLPARTQTGETRVVHLLRDVSPPHHPADHVAEAAPSLQPHAHGASPEPASPGEQADMGPRPSLTRREYEVLRLLARGLANGEIAAKLGISPITARNHVTNVIEKLRVRTRLQAVVVASQLGLL